MCLSQNVEAVIENRLANAIKLYKPDFNCVSVNKCKQCFVKVCSCVFTKFWIDNGQRTRIHYS